MLSFSPRFLQVTHNLHNLAYLKNLMRMVRALLQSNNLHIEPYVRLISFLTTAVRECTVSSLPLVDASTARRVAKTVASAHAAHLDLPRRAPSV